MMNENEKPITVWPFELIFACIVPAFIAVAASAARQDQTQLFGLVLLSAILYLLGFGFARAMAWRRIRTTPGNDISTFLFIYGLAFVIYYAVVAFVFRSLILSIAFRMAGVSTARIPALFGSKSG